MKSIQENIFSYLWSWLLEVGGGVDVKFGKFDGRERATKIEQVRTREEFWSLGDNVTIECPVPHEKVFTIGKIERFIYSFSNPFKANLILLANSSTSGQYTNYWPCPVSLRVTTRRPVTFAVAKLNLHWGNSHSIIYK